MAARDDPEAFALFYERNRDRVLGFFYRRTRCPHASVELTAETFAQAFGSLDGYDERRGSGPAWLLGIAANLHRQWLRKSMVADRAWRRLHIGTRIPVHEDLERVEELADITRLRPVLREALDELSPRVRQAVVMRIALEYPYERVAAELGCTVGAARVRVARGLALLASRMEGLA